MSSTAAEHLLSINNVHVDYTPILSLSSLSSSTMVSYPILPTFNADGLPYTPTFEIPYNLPLDVEMHKARFLESALYQEHGNTEMLQPRPRKTYCSVCSKDYKDYLSHIRSKLHRTNIHKSPFDLDIKELISNIPLNNPNAFINHSEAQISPLQFNLKIAKLEKKLASFSNLNQSHENLNRVHFQTAHKYQYKATKNIKKNKLRSFKITKYNKTIMSAQTNSGLSDSSNSLLTVDKYIVTKKLKKIVSK